VPVEAKKVAERPQEAEQKKRAREEDAPVHKADDASAAPAPAAAAANGAAADEPAKKKKKKSKKAKGEASEAGEANGAAPAAATQENGAPSVKAFLAEAVTPLLAGGDVSLADVRAKVVEQATAKGLKVDEVESALWAGLKVGGKKQKVRAEFA